MRWIVVACLAASWIPAFGQPSKPSAGYDALVARARTLIAERRPQEAVTVSEQAIALNERRWEAYVTAASGYSAQHLYDDTIGMLQTALAHAPDEKKQAIREAISDARRQLAAQSNPNPAFSPQSSPQAAPAITTQAEAVLWKSIENSTRAEDYQGYLSKYPDGTFAPVATARLDAITSKQADEAAQQQKARDSNLVGSGWQGTVGDLTATLKFTDGNSCALVLVDQNGVTNFTCGWQKIGEALYVTVNAACSYPIYDNKGRVVNTAYPPSVYVLTLQDETASGLEKSDTVPCKGRQISLKRSE